VSFLHWNLLGGLALIGVPILIHLVTREKPKHLRFPAFRFLLQKFQTNRRKLRLHHLLLLLLRMALIAALCFALARPQLHDERLKFLGGDQPVLVALVVDTSPSMEFERGGLTRLEDARRRALELLEEVPDGSRIALFDTGLPGAQFESAATIREQLKGLQIRPANSAVSRVLEQAYKLLNDEAEARGAEGEPPARFLYVFSDRTRASWDPSDVRGLKQPEGVNLVYVDVGADKPIDLAIEQAIIDPPAGPPGSTIQVRALVGATGDRADRKISCQIDNDVRLQEQIVKAEADSRRTMTFDYRAAAQGADPARDSGLPSGVHQIVLRLEGTDRLPFNNVHYGTFVIRPGRKVLTLMDEVKPQPWTLALDVLKFTSVVRSIRDLDRVDKLDEFDVICLHQVTDPSAQWKKLYDRVAAGGKLVVIPGGSMVKAVYNDDPTAKQLLPATFIRTLDSERGGGTGWDWSLSNTAPLMAPFLRWKREQSDLEFWKTRGEPKVHRWWEVSPRPEGRIIAKYADEKTHSPALMERNVGAGKVVLFTTKLDYDREIINKESVPWQTYWQSSFGFVLTDKVCRYLAGDSVALDWNYQCGQTVTIPVPRDAGNKFLLRGPGQPVQGKPLSLPPEDRETKERVLAINQAELPGNYVVLAVRNDRQEILEAFSMNVKPEESNLSRVPKEEIEEVLGKDSVLGVEHNLSLKEAINKKPQSIELLPYLMLLLLLFLAGENLLGNRSLDRKPLVEPTPAAVEQKPSWRAVLIVLLSTALGIALGFALSFLWQEIAGSQLAGMVIFGLLGLFHGLVAVARFNPRDGAIFGGLLGSFAGVLFGWLILGMMSSVDGTFAVFSGMILGAGLLALDGWLLGLRVKPIEAPRKDSIRETVGSNV
jgi:hypothetical protein